VPQYGSRNHEGESALFLELHDKTALVWRDCKISYAELHSHIAGMAEGLQASPGEHVAIFSENRLEWAFAFYAIWLRDAVAVPIDFMSAPDEVAYILNDCQPRLIYCSRGKEAVLRKALAATQFSPQVIFFEDAPVASRPALTAPLAFPEQTGDKTAVIIYTSGTTGTPKGVELTFDNLLANTVSVSRDIPIYNSQQMVMILLPLHHILPLLGTLIAPLYIGGTCAFCPSMASEDIMRTLQDNHVSLIVGVPRFYNLIRKGIRDKIDKSALAKTLFALAEKVNSPKFSRLLFKKVHEKFGGRVQYMVCGGAALDLEVARDFKTLGFEILAGYGMTEAAPMISFTRPGLGRLGSAGQIMQATEVKIVDGEITARGRNIMKGYYQRPEETAAVLEGGWLHTGDLGYVDQDDFLFITGRKKEIIVLPNGKNINPEEIEFKLLNMSASLQEVGVFMKDGLLQAVVLPDMRQVREHGLEKVEQQIRHDVVESYNRAVSPYKRLMKVSLINEELPKTRLGKIKRFELASLTGAKEQAKASGGEPTFHEYRVLKEFLADQSDREVFADDHIEIDLGLDSLDMVSLQAFLKSTFGLDVHEDVFIQYPTLQKLAEFVQEKKLKFKVEAVNWGEIFREKITISLPKSWFTQNLFKNCSRYLFKAYFNLSGTGLENIPDTPCIIAPNHQSYIDGLFVSVFLKNKVFKNTYFYAKVKHVRQRWLKFLANRNNVIVMDVNHDLKLSLQKMAKALQEGRNIIIFPEGTRSRDGRLGQFKKTFAILSRELNVPIVPVAINGAFEALPPGSFFPRPRKKVSVEFLRPIYPENHSYETLTDEVSEKVMNSLSRG
jgi:long-chain acyl-CoA synthetase